MGGLVQCCQNSRHHKALLVYFILQPLLPRHGSLRYLCFGGLGTFLNRVSKKKKSDEELNVEVEGGFSSVAFLSIMVEMDIFRNAQ